MRHKLHLALWRVSQLGFLTALLMSSGCASDPEKERIQELVLPGLHGNMQAQEELCSHYQQPKYRDPSEGWEWCFRAVDGKSTNSQVYWNLAFEWAYKGDLAVKNPNRLGLVAAGQGQGEYRQAAAVMTKYGMMTKTNVGAKYVSDWSAKANGGLQAYIAYAASPKGKAEQASLEAESAKVAAELEAKSAKKTSGSGSGPGLFKSLAAIGTAAYVGSLSQNLGSEQQDALMRSAMKGVLNTDASEFNATANQVKAQHDQEYADKMKSIQEQKNSDANRQQQLAQQSVKQKDERARQQVLAQPKQNEQPARAQVQANLNESQPTKKPLEYDTCRLQGTGICRGGAVTKTSGGMFYVGQPNHCGYRLFTEICIKTKSGRDDCGAEAIQPGGTMSVRHASDDVTGQFKVTSVGVLKGGDDWSCMTEKRKLESND